MEGYLGMMGRAVCSFKCLRKKLLIRRANAATVNNQGVWVGEYGTGILCSDDFAGHSSYCKTNCFYNCLKKNHLSSSGEFELHFKNKHIFLEITSHCAAKVGIPLLILLPQPSKCQGYKCVLPHLVSSWRIRFCLVFLAQTWHTSSPPDLPAGGRCHKYNMFTLADSRASPFAYVHGSH